jgi:hypothetical protein
LSPGGLNINLPSLREFKAKNLKERKRLLESLSDYLRQTGIEAELQEEPAIKSTLDIPVPEPVIQLKGQNLDKIRLVRAHALIAIPASILRFRYEVLLDKDLSIEQIKNASCITELIKDSELTDCYGSHVVAVKWVGHRLAGILNQDQSILDGLLRCAKLWDNLEFKIEAISSREVFIIGPQFTNPSMIAELSKFTHPAMITEFTRIGVKKECECCVFGCERHYKTLDKIAQHIKSGLF